MILTKMKLICAALNLVVPGWGFFASEQYRFSTFFFAVPFLVLLAICWSGFVFEQLGIILLLLLLPCVGLFTWLFALVKPMGRPTKTTKLKLFLTCLYPMTFVFLVFSLYHAKHLILGFQLYYVPSDSMIPSIYPSDIVVADTWLNQESLEVGDVVVFKHPTIHPMKIIKRIRAIMPHQRMKILGDNPMNSLDSRTLGLIDMELVQARARLKYSPRAQGLLKLSEL